MTSAPQWFPPEFRLALACIRWPMRAQDRESIRTLAAGSLNWEWFVRIIHNNDVLPLAYRNLSEACASVPAEVALQLRTQALNSAHHMLRQATELVRLVKELENSGICVTVLKGVPLSLVAFGDPAMRTCLDIDLMVSADDIKGAEDILLKSSYQRTKPKAALTPKRLKYYSRYFKDLSYFSPNTGVAIELHWRLFKNAFMPMQSADVLPSTMPVPIAGAQITTLSREDLFVYLCLHGAIHAWASLKWLADLGALLNAMSEAEFAQVMERAALFDASPELGAAMILLRRFIGIERGPAEPARESRSVVERIVRSSTKALTSNEYCRGVREAAGWRMFLYTLLLRPSWRYRRDVIIDNAVLPQDWESFDLPDALFPLYLGIRPLSWLLRRGTYGKTSSNLTT